MRVWRGARIREMRPQGSQALVFGKKLPGQSSSGAVTGRDQVELINFLYIVNVGFSKKLEFCFLA